MPMCASLSPTKKQRCMGLGWLTTIKAECKLRYGRVKRIRNNRFRLHALVDVPVSFHNEI
jgi:hypothetical protein